MVKWWRLIKDQFCTLMEMPCQCPDIKNHGKIDDCDKCQYYRYWVYLGRPKRPFHPDEWELGKWWESLTTVQEDNK